MKIKTKILSSLHKVFCNETPSDFEYNGKESIFKNETYSFQIGYNSSDCQECYVKINLNNNCLYKMFLVKNVPSELPTHEYCDTNYLKTEPGLYPDFLYPIENKHKIVMNKDVWNSIWVELCPYERNNTGEIHVNVQFISMNNKLVGEIETKVMVYDEILPKQKLIHTEWLHTDCLCDYYEADAFTPRYWKIVKEYIKEAVSHGVNMILTPLFTPPLDTEVGRYRRTVQLVDIHIENGSYKFKFEKLEQWVEMCQETGIEFFEMNHLFTQWGAKYAPKIMASVNGKHVQIFGWETNADSAEYKEFLTAFLPALTEKLKDMKIEKNCYFHVSDEPEKKDFENYNKAYQIVKPLLREFKIIDAVSDIDFYLKGIMETPIPSTDHIQPFLDEHIDGLWTYYCNAQSINVSNRFMAMPSSRNRIIGVQLYKYSIFGFLHWGYNFWNTQYSIKSINPYEVTDSGKAFPSGDAFIVYPGDDRPLPSLRLKILAQAMCDIRALRKLESLSSKEEAVKIIDEGLSEPIRFDCFPPKNDYLIKLRIKINKKIMELLAESYQCRK